MIKVGLLRVEKIVEHKDGSMNVIFIISTELKKFIRDSYGKRRFSQKIFKEFVIESICNHAKEVIKKEIKKENGLKT